MPGRLSAPDSARSEGGGVTAYAPEKRLPPLFLDTLLMHKAAAASANQSLGVLPGEIGSSIVQQVQALRAAGMDDPGPSIWRSGCGLEFNRWANERLAQACAQAGSPAVTPEHVNWNQSTNDTMPTVLQLALLRAYHDTLAPALGRLRLRLDEGRARVGVHRIMGRTFLRDAKWMRLAEVLGGWADLIDAHHGWLREAVHHLARVPQGGYSLGNGDGADPGFAAAYVASLFATEGIECRVHPSPGTEIAGIRSLAAFAAALGNLCAGIEKMASDILLLCSGPRHGFGDLTFEETANDSTTLRGKSNPIQATALQMACVHARAQACLVADLAARGQLALFTGFPLIAHALLDAVHVLALLTDRFADEFVPQLRPSVPAGNTSQDSEETHHA